MFHGRRFFRNLGICNSICVKLLQTMSGVMPRNLKETMSLSQTVFLPSTNEAHTHTDRQTDTHTHDDSIRRNAMRYISPKMEACSGQRLWWSNLILIGKLLQTQTLGLPDPKDSVETWEDLIWIDSISNLATHYMWCNFRSPSIK